MVLSFLAHLSLRNGATKSMVAAARAHSELDRALRPLPGLCHHIPHGKVVPRESDRHRLGLPRLEHHVREALENRRGLSRGCRMVHVQLRNLIVCVNDARSSVHASVERLTSIPATSPVFFT